MTPISSKTAILLRAPFAAIAMAAALTPNLVQARDCGPEALGVSRIIEINRHQGTTLGLQTYPRTLALADHELVLTFDDGPAGPTPHVLDALAKECVKATFFMIGSNAEHLSATVRRAAQEGHSLGHHTYSHALKTLRRMGEAEAIADIDKGMAAVTRAAGGASAPFFRFPGFADTPALVENLNKRGITIFGSDIWASDWETMTPKAELDRLLARVEKARKGIVLMHDLKSYTAAMLPEFLRELKLRGFKIVHITPGEGQTPIVAAGPGWRSTTEAILAKSPRKQSSHAHGARETPARDDDATPAAEPH